MLLKQQQHYELAALVDPYKATNMTVQFSSFGKCSCSSCWFSSNNNDGAGVMITAVGTAAQQILPQTDVPVAARNRFYPKTLLISTTPALC